MGKSTISMVIFNSYVKLPEGTKIRFLGKFWPFLQISNDLERISKKKSRRHLFFRCPKEKMSQDLCLVMSGWCFGTMEFYDFPYLSIQLGIL
jgi:hypothetical protein